MASCCWPTTGLALLWANLAQDSYRDAWDTGTAIGPAWLHLDLTLGDWAADGLLAIFFFVAGMELKRERRGAGTLRGSRARGFRARLDPCGRPAPPPLARGVKHAAGARWARELR